MRPPVREVAQGRWPGILFSFGMTAKQLSGKHTACPVCGGNDRFRFDDKEGRGTFYCSHCGSGDGIALVMGIKGLDFKTAAQEIESIAGVVPETQKVNRPETDKRGRVRKIWERRERLTEGDEVHQYLNGRGIATVPKSLHKVSHGVFVGNVWQPYPAMLAKAVNGGKAVGLHLTYLSGGKKANVEKQKVCYATDDGALNGSAIRLHEAGETLILAEGIETALSAAQIFGYPSWAAMNATLLERVTVPDSVKTVIVAADNDENFVGQAAAYQLAKRLVKEGFDVEVKVPPAVGDWADVLQGARSGNAQADTSRMRQHKERQ